VRQPESVALDIKILTHIPPPFYPNRNDSLRHTILCLGRYRHNYEMIGLFSARLMTDNGENVNLYKIAGTPMKLCVSVLDDGNPKFSDNPFSSADSPANRGLR